MNVGVASQIKRQEESCTGKYSRGLRNQNGGHLVDLCESYVLKTQAN